MEYLSTESRILGTVLFIILFLYTVNLLRTNKLSAHHAMSWIIAELVMLVLLVFYDVSAVIMSLIGVDNVLSFAVLIAAIWGVLLMLDLLVRLSELSTKLREVNQELALLDERYDRLQRNFIELMAENQADNS